MKIQNVTPATDTVTLHLADDTTRTVNDVTAVVFGAESPPRPLEYVDCARVPADVAAIRRVIERDGECRVIVLKPGSHQYVTVSATQYLEAVQPHHDDLRLSTGGLLSQEYWKSYWKPLPSLVARTVYGYWQ